MAVRSKRSHEGYLFVDHRDSPGVPDSLIQAAVAAGHPVTQPGRSLFESATVTCAHCQAVVILNPDRSRPRHYCAKCDHYVCDNAICVKECRPFKHLLDVVEAQLIHGDEAPLIEIVRA